MTAPPVQGVHCPSCPHTHSAEETAALTGIGVGTLRKRAGNRTWPSTMAGSNLRFSHDNIAEIIALCERPAAPQRRRAPRRTNLHTA